MESRKTIGYLVFGVFVLAVAVFLFTADVGDYELIKNNTVPIQAEFESKIVYTTDSLADTAPLIEDCEMRGGVFNACGSICGPTAEICASVCAFTCELNSRQ